MPPICEDRSLPRNSVPLSSPHWSCSLVDSQVGRLGHSQASRRCCLLLRLLQLLPAPQLRGCLCLGLRLDCCWAPDTGERTDGRQWRVKGSDQWTNIQALHPGSGCLPPAAASCPSTWLQPSPCPLPQLLLGTWRDDVSGMVGQQTGSHRQNTCIAQPAVVAAAAAVADTLQMSGMRIDLLTSAYLGIKPSVTKSCLPGPSPT